MPIISGDEGRPILEVFANQGGLITIKDVLQCEESRTFSGDEWIVTVHPDDVPALIERLQEVASQIEGARDA